MRPWPLLLLFLVSVLYADAGLADSSASEGAKIGFILPLTGPLAEVGEDIRRGAELSLERAPANLGTNARPSLIFEDNQSSRSNAAAAARKLIAIDQLKVLVTLWDSAEVVAPIAEQSDVVHLAIRWNSDLTERYTRTVTVESSYRSWCDDFLKLFVAESLRKVVIIHAESPGWVLAVDALRALAPNYGVEILDVVSYPPGERDLNGVATVVRKQRNVDAILILALSPELEDLARRVMVINPKVYVTGYLQMLRAPEVFEGRKFVTQMAVADWFTKLFVERYGEAPFVRAQLSYDIVSILSKLLAECPNGNCGTRNLIDGLNKITDYRGASGNLRSNGKRSIETENVVMKISSGIPVRSR